ncbi:MAG: hypothetical protein QXS23_06770, partial [Desulfurococcaceae archaeon]
MLTSLRVKDIAIFKHGNIGIMFKRLDKNLVEIELYRHNNRDVIGVIGLAENDEITLVPYPLGRESNIKCLMFKLKQPI